MKKTANSLPAARLSRRQWLVAAAGAGMSSVAAASDEQASTLPTATATSASRRVTLLYHRTRDAHVARSDPAAQAALAQVQTVLQRMQLQVMLPSPEDQAQLDSLGTGQLPYISLAPGSGGVVLVGVTASQWQRQDEPAVEARIDAQLLLGQTVVLTLSGDMALGQATVMQPGEAAQTAALRHAATLAGRSAARQVGQRLKALSDAELASMERPIGRVDEQGRVHIVNRPASALASPGQIDTSITRLPEPRRRIAVLVALSDYSALNERLRGRMKMNSLPGVALDLQHMKDTLRSRDFAEADIFVLSGERATGLELRRKLLELARSTQPGDLVLVAISAHGAPARYTLSGYGMPVLNDFKPDPDPMALDFFSLQALIGHLPAQQAVLIVDTCHAGGAALHMPRLTPSASRGLAVTIGTVTPNAAQLVDTLGDNRRHYAVLVAARPEELSLEASPNGGLFTHTLTQAIAQANGSQPLARLFAEQVQPKVLEMSRPICQQLRECQEQNAGFAFSGRGDLIRL